MRYLYIDNFRGFQNTLIPIKSVNFLVGENSTGKTSILALLSLLSSPEFWITQNFNSRNHELGGFKDIVSINSEDKSYFRFGFFEEYKDKNGNTEYQCSLFSYKEKDGLPDIYCYSKFIKNKVAYLKFRGHSYLYKIDYLQYNVYNETNVKDLFILLMQEHKKNNAGYKEIKIKIHKKNSLVPLISILNSLALEKEPDLEDVTISIPFFTSEIAWLAPIRTKPKRTYDGYGKPYSPDGEHTPYLIRKNLSLKKYTKKFREKLDYFGKDSNLFHDILIKQYGKETTSPFELLVILDNEPLKINSVGYGVSQAMPVVVELLVRNSGTWFAIQQPEVHLHPRAQAAIGDLLFLLSSEEDKSFLIETHSDFTIDRFRLNVKKNQGSNLDSQILFFERKDKKNLVSPIDILKNGNYSDNQPVTFRDFFIKEQLQILGL